VGDDGDCFDTHSQQATTQQRAVLTTATIARACTEMDSVPMSVGCSVQRGDALGV
jgi:hypothetical protein